MAGSPSCSGSPRWPLPTIWTCPAHGAPFLHAPALAAIPNLRHTEWFCDHVEIEQRLFAGTSDPVDGALQLSDEGSGHGLTWRADAASPFRVF